MPWPDPITLRGQHARLEPLSKAHLEYQLNDKPR